mgnify:CR=1 FL=1
MNTTEERMEPDTDIRDDHPSGAFRGIFYGLAFEILVGVGLVLATMIAINAFRAIGS